MEALKKPLIMKRETWLCSEALNNLSNLGNKVRICWISKKAGTSEIGTADELARKGRNSTRKIFVNVRQQKINDDILQVWKQGKKKLLWQEFRSKNGYRMPKAMLNGFGEPRFSFLPNLSKRNLRLVIALCTGAAPLNSCLHKIYRYDPTKRHISDRCRFCLIQREDMHHLIYECNDLRIRNCRRDSFGHSFVDTDKMKILEIKELLAFAEGIKLTEILLMKNANPDDDSDSE